MNSVRMLAFIFAIAFASNSYAVVDVLVSSLLDVPDPAVRGGEITYSIEVANLGLDTADDVVMTFPLPATTEFSDLIDSPACVWAGPAPGTVTCTYPALIGSDDDPPGVPETANVVIRTTQATPVSIDVEATVTTTSDEVNTGNNTLDQNTTIDDGADLITEFTSVSPDPVIAGGEVTYTNVVTNQGPNNAQAVRVVFQISINMTYVAGSASGSGWSCSYNAPARELTCTRPGLDTSVSAPAITWRGKVTGAQTGTLTNSAQVAADTGDPLPNNNSDTIDVTVTEGTDLTISVSASPMTVLSEGSTSLTLRPRNLGPFDASNVVVTYTAPDGLVIGTPTGSGWACGVVLQVVTCTRGTYVVGATDDITIPLTVPLVLVPTVYGNPVSIATDTAEANLANNNDSVNISVTPDGVDLSITKSKAPNPVAQGSTLISSIRVSNSGPRDAAASTITVTDTLGPYEVYEGVYSGTNWTCSGSPSVITCTYGAILLNGATTPVLSLTTRAIADSVDRDLTNRASVGYSGDPGDYNNGNNETGDVTVTSTIAIADLALAKSAEAGVAALGDNNDGDPARLNADPGPPELLENTVRYTLTITNNGPNDAGGITLTDPIPGYIAGTGVSVISQPANYTCTTGSSVGCVQDGGTVLANGASDTFVIDVTRPLGAGSRTNNASAFSSEVGDNNRDNNRASSTVFVEAVADVQVQSKVIINENDEVKSGVDATYIISIRNNGPSAAADVEVIDTFSLTPGDTGFTFISVTDTGNGAGCSGMTAGSSYPDDGVPVLTCDMGSMNSGNAQTITVKIRPNFMASPPTPRTMDNSVSVSTTTYDDDHSNDQLGPVTLTIIEDEIDLLINNSDEPDPVAWDPASGGDNANNDVVYNVTYTNRGPSYATGVRYLYTMTPKAGKTVRFDCDEANSGDACGTSADTCVIDSGSNPVTGGASLVLSCDANTVPGKTNEMTAGSSGSRYLHFRILSEPDSTGDTHQTVADISANEFEPVTGNNSENESTSVRARVDLEIVDKVPSEGNVQLDQPFNWTITLVNNGPLASDQTDLTDVLPAGMSFHGPQPSWVNAVDATADLCATTDQTMECDLGSMSVGATAVITVPVMVDEFSVASLENCATATTIGIDVIPDNNEDVCGQVSVENTYFPSDYGDAPDTTPGMGVGDYATTLDHGGPRHMLPGGTWLGACVDSDGEGSQQDASALADDTNAGPVEAGSCEGGDDEDGILLPPALIASQPGDVEIIISGGTCALDGWIDYNADGDFTDPGEQVFAALALDAGGHTQVVTPPADIAVGTTYSRFRCSDSGGLDSVEETTGGEVEDYLVFLQPDGNAPGTPTDYGDAPDSDPGTAVRDYQTVSLDNGASHILGRPAAPYLGLCVDSDPQDQESLDALADDSGVAGGAGVTTGSCETADDDEDGVLFTAPLQQGATVAAIDVTASSGTNACILNAWIDFNDDGDFTDPGEQIASDQTIASGATAALSPAVPVDAAIGVSYARFRCDSNGGLNPVGAANDGEVEDYLVEIRPSLAIEAVDFGDAPDTSDAQGTGDYTTIEANNGPSHVLVSGESPYLGACVDSDAGLAQNVAADADDTTPAEGAALVLGTCAVPNQDEDGIVLPSVIYQGGTLAFDLVVGPVADCVLNGWIDFNQDGDFTGPGEQVLSDQPQGTGTTQSYPFTVPVDAELGDSYARFRCSSIDGLGPQGPGRDGEVEDYLLNIVAGVARFRVTKDFSDRNPVPVDVQLSCNTGLPLQQQFTISDSDDPATDVVFVVASFESGTMDCEVTETPIAGYTVEYDNLIDPVSEIACFYTNVERGAEHVCAITNTLQPVPVTIDKKWETMGGELTDIPQQAEIKLVCLNVAGGESEWQWIFEGDQANTALVLPHFDGTTECYVSESVLSDSVEVSGCEEPIVVNPGDEAAGCTLTNTVFYEGIPTLNQYGLAMLVMLMLGAGLVGVRRSAYSV